MLLPGSCGVAYHGGPLPLPHGHNGRHWAASGPPRSTACISSAAAAWCCCFGAAALQVGVAGGQSAVLQHDTEHGVVTPLGLETTGRKVVQVSWAAEGAGGLEFNFWLADYGGLRGWVP